MPGIGFSRGKPGHSGLGLRFPHVLQGVSEHEGPRMAKWCAAFVAAAVFALAGCQPQQPVAMVKNLPPPNFDGPGDLTPPSPAPIVRPPAPVVVAPPEKSKPVAGVPAAWVPTIRANAWR